MKNQTMNIGSLYLVKKYYWLLFSSKESAIEALGGVVSSTASAAACLSKLYKEKVTYFSPDSYIVLLEEDGNLKRVLTSDGLIGWTWVSKDYNDCFEEVKSE
jgi:hypothetical protein